MSKKSVMERQETSRKVVYGSMTMARFWSKVDVQKSTAACWPWKGATKGVTGDATYGRIKIDGQTMTSSRVAWEMFFGKPLGKNAALHRCDNKSCCNPLHIYRGTISENHADRVYEDAIKEIEPKKGRRFLQPNEVGQIKAALREGLCIFKIAAATGQSVRNIKQIQKGERWADVQPREEQIAELRKKIIGDRRLRKYSLASDQPPA